MTDLKQFALLDPARDRQPSQAEWTRSRAALERLLVAAPSTNAQPVRRWVIGLTAVAAAAVAGVVAVPALLPDAADKAIASWTPEPGTLTGADVLPQAKACAGQGLGLDAATLTSADVLLADQRGAATSMILRQGDLVVECMSVDAENVFTTMPLTDRPLPPPGPEHITVETQSSVGEGDSQYSQIVGQIDDSVTGIDLTMNDGTTVRTSSKAGWWTAWWPGPEGGEVDQFQIHVHTATGTKTYRQSQF